MNKGLSGQLTSSNKYSVHFANSESDVRAAQSLRFWVFNLELGERLDKSFKSQRDTDKDDQQCDHLLVLDRTRNKVIGTPQLFVFIWIWEPKGYQNRPLTVNLNNYLITVDVKKLDERSRTLFLDK